ncbi:MAG: T9SS type A sorting domain-containing protein [Bacteroidales bacterium]|nr:T9SS type A sorting domain-containing protein [Bacteroidales bacterium]
MKKLLSTAVSLLLAVVATAQTYTSLDNAPDGIYRIDDGGYIRAAEHVIGLNSSLSLLETQLNFVLKVPDKSYSSCNFSSSNRLVLSTTDELHTVTPVGGVAYQIQHFTISSVQIDTTLTSQMLIDDNRFRAFSMGQVHWSAEIDSAAFNNCPEQCRPVTYNLFYSTCVYKDYAQIEGLINTVVGNPCVSDGEQVTFSVAPYLEHTSQSSDTYYWEIPTSLMEGGSPDYYSHDHSSVTFTLARSVQSGDTIRVRMGKYNQNKPTSIILPLDGAVPEPQLVNANCIPMGVRDIVLKLSNAEPSATYSWSWRNDNGWELFGNSGDSIIVRSSEYSAATITVIATSSNPKCQSSQSDIMLTRSLAGGLASIGDVSCAQRGDQIKLGITNGTDNVHYKWEIPAGWSCDSLKHARSLTLMADAATPHTSLIYVSVIGCDTTDARLVSQVTLNPAAPTFASDLFCVSSGQNTFQLTPPNNQGDNYQWSFDTNSWYTTSGQGTATFTSYLLNANNAGNKVNVTATSVNGCQTVASAALGVVPAKPNIRITKTGNSISTYVPNIGTADDFYVRPVTIVPNASYSWSVPTELQTYVQGGLNNSTLHLQTPATLHGAFDVSVSVNTVGSCGSVSSDELTINLTDGLYLAVAFEAETSHFYSICGLQDSLNVTNYQVTSATTSQEYLNALNPLFGLQTSMTEDDLIIVVTYSDGHTLTHVEHVVYSTRGRNIGLHHNMGNKSLYKSESEETVKPMNLIYPNPASREFNVRTSGDSGIISVFASNGKLVHVENFDSGDNIVNVKSSSWVNGTYIVVVNQGGRLSCDRILIVK